MDEAEKRVVRWRKQLISEKLKVTEELLNDCKDTGLITADIVKQLERENNNPSKVQKLLDFVMACPEPGSFATLLFVLSKENGWAVKDLEMDLKMEKGELDIEAEIMTEANMLVHRKFGTSKRLCQTDKKDIGDLIAAKLQLQKEEWDREKGALELEIKRLKEQISEKDKRSHSVAKQLRDFLREHDRQLTTHAHGMTSTTQVLEYTLEDVNSNMLSKIERTLKSMLDRLDKVIKHREHLMKERERTLKVLGEKDEKNTTLDDSVRKALNTATAPTQEALQVATKDTSEKDQLIRRLNNRITQLEHEIMDLEEGKHETPKQNGTGVHKPMESHDLPKKTKEEIQNGVAAKKTSTVTPPAPVQKPVVNKPVAALGQRSQTSIAATPQRKPSPPQTATNGTTKKVSPTATPTQGTGAKKVVKKKPKSAK